MIRRACCLGLALLLAACSGTGWRALPGWLEARSLVERADGLALDGDHVGARTVYLRVIQEYSSSPWAAQALLRLARLQVIPESPIRDYRQAHRHFERLLVEYPGSPEAREARAWREVLGQLLAREEEAARIRQDLERLKKIDRDLEKRRP